MTDTRIQFESIVDSFLEFVDSCGKLNSFTRSKRLQSEKIDECEHFVQIIKSYKAQAIERSQEQAANEFFHMQCCVNALKSVLLMWITLKDEKYQRSWSYLIDAQEYTTIALKVKSYEGILSFQEKLNSIEDSVFPGWALYHSPGFIESIGKCSICGEEFIACDHIENEIYFGSLCQRIERDILELNHTALVEDPRDKRCITTHISDDDGCMIDYFTWEKTGEHVDEKEGAIGHMKSVTFAFPSLDVH